MKCTLCGFEFEPTDSLCRGCPLKSNCSMVCCPNCGYQTVVDSPGIRLMRRILGRSEPDENKDE